MATQTPPRSASRYYAASAAASEAAVAAVKAVRPRGLRSMWQTLAAYQVAQARVAEEATAIMLSQQDIDVEAEALLNSSAFTTSVNSFERMLEDVDTDWRFEQLVSSLVQDVGRSAQSVSIAARPRIGHVRMLTPPSCSRCAVLAGRVYRYSTGFLRHPGCFPEGTVVSGPRASRATRRWYEGELVVIRTAGGKNLTATANHPILTDKGWLPANLLTEGGYVVSRSSGERSGSLLVPDHDQVPARIEDVWRAGRVRSLGRVPVSAEDFHGDGLGSSQVDVVSLDGFVGNGQQVAILQELREKLFALRIELAVALNASRSGLQFGGGHLALAGGGLGALGLLGTSIRGQLARPEQSGLAWASDGDLGLYEASANQGSAESGSLRERVLTFPREVGRDQGGVVDGSPSDSRWDAPAASFSHENSGAYASQGLDLRDRLSSNVELDRVVELRRFGWGGHVYNLTSTEGWYDADGIIVSNCDCTMIPTTLANPDFVQDPESLMERGLVTGLSKADQKAIRDGADFAQVVNVRLRSGGVNESGRVLYRRGRMTPEAIYRTTATQEEALAALQRAGYLR